jgi:hypothetical protein
MLATTVAPVVVLADTTAALMKGGIEPSFATTQDVWFVVLEVIAVPDLSVIQVVPSMLP